MSAVAVELLGVKQAFQFAPKSFDVLANGYAGLRRTKLSNLSTERAYYFSGFVAQLEQALISYSTKFLKQRGFQFISVPDIISPEILQGCGMARQDNHNMIYFLDEKRHGKFALSGTSEMAIAALHRNKTLRTSELPLRLSAVSRCFRAEVSDINEGIYRVHEFTKVEMFGVCRGELSQELFLEFVSIQRDFVKSLQLHAQVLDMPTEDLGLSANQKYDIEAWMPGQGPKYGEISSASNCRDYQSSRLKIRHAEGSQGAQGAQGAQGSQESQGAQGSQGDLVHTVNGTACAIPRLILAIMEQHQMSNGVIRIPPVLRKYFADAETAEKPRGPPGIYWRKSKKEKKQKIDENIVLEMKN